MNAAAPLEGDKTLLILDDDAAFRTRLARAQRVAGPSYNDLSDPARLDGPSGNAALNGLPVRIERLA